VELRDSLRTERDALEEELAQEILGRSLPKGEFNEALYLHGCIIGMNHAIDKVRVLIRGDRATNVRGIPTAESATSMLYREVDRVEEEIGDATTSDHLLN